MTATMPHNGQILGYQGHRAVVFDVDDSLEAAPVPVVRVLFFEDLPPRHCHHCNGEGWISLGIWRGAPPGPERTQSCDRCRGTGELPAERVARDEWVSVDDLEEAPAPVEREDAAEVGAFLANPRAVFGEGL